MSDTPRDEFFSFAMGEFEAAFPLDRQYAKNHMWAKCVAPSERPRAVTWRFGLSAYAVRLLQDVYFLDWETEPPATVTHRQMIGTIESKKAESDLFAPMAGVLSAVNQEVLSNPSLINADPYGQGWMIEMTVGNENSQPLLTPQQYGDHLKDAWEVAQRTIKGQANV